MIVVRLLSGMASAIAAFGFYVALPVFFRSKLATATVWQFSPELLILALLVLFSYTMSRCAQFPRSLETILDSDEGELWKVWGRLLALVGILLMGAARVFAIYGSMDPWHNAWWLWLLWIGAGPVFVPCIAEVITVACRVCWRSYRESEWLRLLRTIGLIAVMAFASVAGWTHWISSYVSRIRSYADWAVTVETETRLVLELLDTTEFPIYSVIAIVGALFASLWAQSPGEE